MSVWFPLLEYGLSVSFTLFVALLWGPMAGLQIEVSGQLSGSLVGRGLEEPFMQA